MKRLFGLGKTVAAIFASLAILSCVEEIPAMTEENVVETEETPIPYTLVVGLSDEVSDTRLSYYESGKSIKTLWSEDDVITANATPENGNWVYKFYLTDGADSQMATFQCYTLINGYAPENISSNGWTLYFPGSSITCEKEYLSKAYTGQIQRGNNNLDHLKDFHSIRLYCTEQNTHVSFDKTFISFREGEFQESACMKFKLSNLPSIVPVEIILEYIAPYGSSDCFHIYNYINGIYFSDGSFGQNAKKSNKLSLKLEDIQQTQELTAFMMMSNASVDLKQGGKFKVYVTTDDGRRFYCDKDIKSDVTLLGSRLHSITCKEWEEYVTDDIEYDGFDNPEDGIQILQEATIGSGTDIIIMGDGFASDQFGKDGNYEKVMMKAYEDFFSVEPYRSLKEYFNVYYINAVSDENHDAEPYFSNTGAQNGAINGSASTLFNTRFTPGSTNITGDDDAAAEYAKQAIRVKGGKNGSACTDEDEVNRRVNSALIMVMTNVHCHAGTCNMVWTYGYDYGYARSVAYTALGNYDDEQCRWTTIHEAGGHGFGKLADEYEGYRYTSFNTSVWNELMSFHSAGVYRNINEHWTPEEAANWSGLQWTYTTPENVYWSELLNDDLGYVTSEGLGIYKGANTLVHLFCRATPNSIMRNQFAEDGRFFNAISRWAIWYRLMKLTGCTSAPDFKSSLDEFLAFDSTLSIDTEERTRSVSSDPGTLPLAPPVVKAGRWEGSSLIIEE